MWSTLFTQNIAAGSTLSKGGVFLATSAAENAQVAFDYVMVVDPGAIPPLSVKITEVMYHPLAPDTVEFIEVQNVGASSVSLSGVHLEDGDPVVGAAFGNVTLAAGAYAVFTNNSAALTAKYGAVANVLQWTSGSLNNGGEKVVLLDAGNNILSTFTYSPTAPWPIAADGSGSSMNIVSLTGNYNDGANWFAASPTPGGATPPPPADSDNDGWSDFIEIKCGTDPFDPNSKPSFPRSLSGSSQFQMTWPSANGSQFRVEYCDSLGSAWQTLTTITGNGSPVNFTDTTAPIPVKRFYRIVFL